ncbi:unnamed protein product [Dovyalis caffra]|uniref:Uncharacterized protein n=1 Tax=Dovyalis caffra TaxID=77055 RepID=A0AAV1SNL9_9ROSI|nr:unnamed protein product [Dovyalis caffra]
MMSLSKKYSPFLGAKATILLILILAARASTLVVVARPKFEARDTYFPQSNRPVQPSGPNPCSYLPAPGHCKPPK